MIRTSRRNHRIIVTYSAWNTWNHNNFCSKIPGIDLTYLFLCIFYLVSGCICIYIYIFICNSTVKYSMLYIYPCIIQQYSTIQYSTIQYSTVQSSTIQSSTAQPRTIKYNTVQSSKVQYSTVQSSTVQYNQVQ